MTPSHPLDLTPPVAPKFPQILLKHGDERLDEYYGMRDHQNPDVIAYLEAENHYTQAMMQHTESLQKSLYDEMLARIKETDLSVPYRKDDYYYYSRTEEGKNYAIFCRKQGSLDAPETIILDQNQLAQDCEYFSLGICQVSPNHQILAYSVDTTGAEQYILYFLDLNTFQLYPESIPDTYASFAWGNDNQTVFYTTINESQRPFKLFRHTLGTDASLDTLVYYETDEAYYLSVGKTRSEAYILMSLGSKITSEFHYLDANYPTGNFQVIHPRQQGMEYEIEHHGDYFYIVTNEDAINFKLMRTPVTKPAKENWELIIPHREEVMLSGVSAFANNLIIFERKSGLPEIRILTLSTGEETYLHFPEPTYTVGEGTNPEFNTNQWRYHYTSLVTPDSIFEYNLDTHEQTLLKETEVLGGYDRTEYQSERLMAPASDGTLIPISLVYKKGLQKNQQNPLLLNGYGSYGANFSPTFSSTRLSLLNRGFVYAIAHIRGGGEMGRKWYEAGKFLAKKNTFTDFIACAEYLIQEQWTSPNYLAISGGSAGGLLMGAVLNLRPELFKAVIADVPFVDVVTTILDPDLPLSVLEWEEWGNPNDKNYYDYMKSYSPYDNVKSQNYPHLLITAGLNDSRVKYWEPAKWAAKLRTLKTDQNLLLLKTNMGAGHSGASGRYEYLKEIAFDYAFLLDRLS